VYMGTAPVELTIQLCALDGTCTTAGFTCVGVPLTKGEGCSTGNLVDNQPLYAKFLITKLDKGKIDGLGSLRVTDPDGNTAAVQSR